MSVTQKYYLQSYVLCSFQTQVNIIIKKHLLSHLQGTVLHDMESNSCKCLVNIRLTVKTGNICVYMQKQNINDKSNQDQVMEGCTHIEKERAREFQPFRHSQGKNLLEMQNENMRTCKHHHQDGLWKSFHSILMRYLQATKWKLLNFRSCLNSSQKLW